MDDNSTLENADSKVAISRIWLPQGAKYPREKVLVTMKQKHRN